MRILYGWTRFGFIIEEGFGENKDKEPHTPNFRSQNFDTKAKVFPPISPDEAGTLYLFPTKSVPASPPLTMS